MKFELKNYLMQEGVISAARTLLENGVFNGEEFDRAWTQPIQHSSPEYTKEVDPDEVIAQAAKEREEAEQKSKENTKAAMIGAGAVGLGGLGVATLLRKNAIKRS